MNHIQNYYEVLLTGAGGVLITTFILLIVITLFGLETWLAVKAYRALLSLIKRALSNPFPLDGLKFWKK